MDVNTDTNNDEIRNKGILEILTCMCRMCLFMISFAQNVENYITTIEITIRSAIIIIKTLDNIDEQLLY